MAPACFSVEKVGAYKLVYVTGWKMPICVPPRFWRGLLLLLLQMWFVVLISGYIQSTAGQLIYVAMGMGVGACELRVIFQDPGIIPPIYRYEGKDSAAPDTLETASLGTSEHPQRLVNPEEVDAGDRCLQSPPKGAHIPLPAADPANTPNASVMSDPEICSNQRLGASSSPSTPVTEKCEEAPDITTKASLLGSGESQDVEHSLLPAAQHPPPNMQYPPQNWVKMLSEAPPQPVGEFQRLNPLLQAVDPEYMTDFSRLPYCQTCEHIRPKEASHCHTCDVCVSREDHHCSVLGTCVGQGNLLSFYIYLLVGTLYATGSTFLLASKFHSFKPSFAFYLYLLLLQVVVTVTVLLVCFSCYNGYVLLCRRTTSRVFLKTRSTHSTSPSMQTGYLFQDTNNSHTEMRPALCAHLRRLLEPPASLLPAYWRYLYEDEEFLEFLVD